MSNVSGHPTLPGWTMAETLISMAIVFTLTGTVGYLGIRQVEQARVTAANSQIRVFEIALENYHLDTGAYPTSDQGLDALYRIPVLAPIPGGWNGPYLRRPPGVSPWGTDYRYRRPGPDGLPYEITAENPGDRRE